MGLFSDPFINYRRVAIYSGIAVVIWALVIISIIRENRPVHKRVVLVVIDGLRSDAIKKLGPSLAPNFHYLIKTGASTMNARTDMRNTQTLPNVISMLTGLPVFDGENAHKYGMNEYIGQAIHDIKGQYVLSIFDVLYQNKLRSSFFASKDKLGLFVKSYTLIAKEKKEGEKDPSRIQSYFITEEKDSLTMEKFFLDLTEFDSSFIFLHLAGLDRIGHDYGWTLDMGSNYMQEVKNMDRYLGKILETIKKNKRLSGQTHLIVTSDHGGDGGNHIDIYNKYNYTVAFIVWGPDVAKGADLYALNKTTRQDPLERIIPYSSEVQPVRNGDAGNLALSLLGLSPIPKSVINGLQSLRVK